MSISWSVDGSRIPSSLRASMAGVWMTRPLALDPYCGCRYSPLFGGPEFLPEVPGRRRTHAGCRTSRDQPRSVVPGWSDLRAPSWKVRIQIGSEAMMDWRGAGQRRGVCSANLTAAVDPDPAVWGRVVLSGGLQAPKQPIHNNDNDNKKYRMAYRKWFPTLSTGPVRPSLRKRDRNLVHALSIPSRHTTGLGRDFRYLWKFGAAERRSPTSEWQVGCQRWPGMDATVRDEERQPENAARRSTR
jgi:hypothetical protein